MKRRKHRYRGYSKRTIILIIALFCSLFFGLGYSMLSTNLGISGSINVNKYDKTLYGVMKRNIKTGLTKKYTSSHSDSMDSSLSTEDIYYWYARSDNDALADQILEKNNVIFAGHCWQMYRTTDTGGVKLIYNGESSSGGQCTSSRGTHVGFSGDTTATLSSDFYYSSQYYYDEANDVFSLRGIIETGSIKEGYYTCNSTSAFGTCSTLYLVLRQSDTSTYSVAKINNNSIYSQFGSMKYNDKYRAMSHIGYMYSSDQEYSTTYSENENMLDYFNLYSSNSYVFGDDVSYNGSVYYLSNPITKNWNEFRSESSGYYTCMSSSSNNCSPVYYIVGASESGSSVYGFKMSGGNLLSDYNSTIVIGDNAVDNGDGTFTISNATAIQKSDWFSGFENYAGLYFCPDTAVCSEPRYFISTKVNKYDFWRVKPVIFANSFTYSNGKYTLSSDRGNAWNFSDSNTIEFLKNHHYTCWNDSGECTEVAYLHYITPYLHYYNYNILSDGHSIDDFINEMFYNDDVNRYSSFAKIGSEAWFRQFLISYNDYLEDVIFCADRSTRSNWLGGFNPNGGGFGSSYRFNGEGFDCPNITDSFSVSNSLAKLDYPIGLLDQSEASRFENSKLLKSGSSYWKLSPYGSGNGNETFCVSETGYLNFIGGTTSSYGYRWVVSLKPGTKFLYGDGSTYHPYVINENREVTLTISYNYLVGGTAHAAYVGKYKPGEKYSIPSPTIEGYTTSVPIVSGTMPNSNLPVTVYYNSSGGSIIDPDVPLDP